MSSVYTDILFEAHALGSGGAFITVPEDERWVVRTVTEFIPGGSTAGGIQVVRLDTDATIIYDTYVTEIGGAWRVTNDLRVVMKEGIEYAIFGFGPNDVGLYGYRLSLP